MPTLTDSIPAPFEVNNYSEERYISGEDTVFAELDSKLSRPHAKSSAYRASYNIICTVVGTGLSGWIGVPLLVILAIMATYTAIVLIRCIDRVHATTYGDVGKAAMGQFGRIVVEIMIHLTLVGVATIYLILAAGNVSELLQYLPDATYGYCSIWNVDYHYVAIILAAIVWCHVFLKTLHEISVLSMFNVCVAVFLLILVLIEVAVNFPPRPVDTKPAIWSLSLGSAYASFAFSYGAHAVLPSVYETMKTPSSFPKMISITFGTVLLFYLPMAIVGYWAYGADVQTPIYDSLCSVNNPLQCSVVGKSGVYTAIIAVTVHVMFSYAIVLNPTELALERLLKTDKTNHPKLFSVLLRTGLVALTLGIGELIKNFGDFLNLVSAVTNSFTSFVFPSLFYMILFWTELDYLTIAWNVLIIVAALLGFAFGGYDSLNAVICDMSQGKYNIGLACSNSTMPAVYQSCF